MRPVHAALLPLVLATPACEKCSSKTPPSPSASAQPTASGSRADAKAAASPEKSYTVALKLCLRMCSRVTRCVTGAAARRPGTSRDPAQRRRRADRTRQLFAGCKTQCMKEDLARANEAELDLVRACLEKPDCDSFGKCMDGLDGAAGMRPPAAR